MLSQLFWLNLGLCLLSIKPVLSSIFCKDSTIDSIEYANDVKMYFIASGGHYWWVKEDRFPPKDEDAKKLPEPFKKTTAAVYIDGDKGCPAARAVGLRAHEKEIWVTEQIDGKHKLIALDTKMNEWSKKGAINYDQDRCLSKARVDWSGGAPIDAMFARNYLEIYVVQGDKYAMVDCHFICTDPDNRFGDDKPQYPTTDFQTKEPIYAMLIKDQTRLIMFLKKIYYVLSIQSAENGKISTSKAGVGKNILSEFLRVNAAEACTGEVTPPPLDAEPSNTTDAVNPEPNPEANPIPNVEPTPASAEEESKEEATTTGSSGGGGILWIIIAIIVIVLIIIAVGLCLLFAMRSKKSENSETSKPDAEGGVGAGGSKVSSKIDSKAGGGSKVGATPSKGSTIGSTASTRSGMGKSAIQSNTGAKSNAGAKSGTGKK